MEYQAVTPFIEKEPILEEGALPRRPRTELEKAIHYVRDFETQDLGGVRAYAINFLEHTDLYPEHPDYQYMQKLKQATQITLYLRMRSDSVTRSFGMYFSGQDKTYAIWLQSMQSKYGVHDPRGIVTENDESILEKKYSLDYFGIGIFNSINDAAAEITDEDIEGLLKKEKKQKRKEMKHMFFRNLFTKPPKRKKKDGEEDDETTEDRIRKLISGYFKEMFFGKTEEEKSDQTDDQTEVVKPEEEEMDPPKKTKTETEEVEKEEEEVEEAASNAVKKEEVEATSDVAGRNKQIGAGRSEDNSSGANEKNQNQEVVTKT